MKRSLALPLLVPFSINPGSSAIQKQASKQQRSGDRDVFGDSGCRNEKTFRRP